MKVGVEIGGTFTDLVCTSPDHVQAIKVPSVPSSPDEGVFAAIAAAGIPIARISEFVHGSTIATNAVLERKGARLAFLVTAGFGDLLLLRRQEREQIFNLFYRKPAPLVPHADTLEIAERIVADGSVVTKLEPDFIESRVIPFLVGNRYDAVAICLLNSFANPAHERLLAVTIGRHLPDLPITCSVDVCPQFREYERASTTVVSAYVQPVMDRYLGRIESRLAAEGFTGTFSVMQSNGSRVPASAMRRNAVTSLLSGPAAGVTGAIKQAARSGRDNLITLDIGGTSADVCLVDHGTADLTQDAKVDHLPVMTPMVDITTVGSGGGSIVWIDDGGMLRVGPQSAGADPGPACYGLGGTRPTVTDAQVLCGRIRPELHLNGVMTFDVAAAAAAFAPLAARLGLDILELADSVVQIFVADVVSAIRLISTRRGRDPRDYALMPYGGAGPLHAAQVADALDIPEVIIPPHPGVLSAFGLLVADNSAYLSVTSRTPVDEAAPAILAQRLAALRQELDAWFDHMGLPGERWQETVLAMRFVGQAFEIPVPIHCDEGFSLSASDIRDRFLAIYESVYRSTPEGRTRAIEVVSLRLGLRIAQTEIPSLRVTAGASIAPGEATCTVHENGQTVEARILARGARTPSVPINGPAVLLDSTSTIWQPAGWVCHEEAGGNLVMRRIS